MRARRHRLIAWIAAFALAVQAFSPLLANAAPRDASLLVPVCSVDGVTHYVELGKDKAPLGEHGGVHCKLCLLGCPHAAALPQAGRIVVASSIPQFASPLYAPESLREALNHPLARPRAPPSLH